MKKVGYDFNNLITLGKVVEVETYGLNKMQKKIQEQEGLVEVLKVVIGYTSLYSIRISGRSEDK